MQLFTFTTLDNNYKKVEKKINELKPTVKHYHLSKNVHLKRIPDIKFIFDDTVL